MSIPSLNDIQKAHRRIVSLIHQTPVLTSSSFNAIVGGQVFFKCENLQKTGSFKIRGASNAILSLSDNEREKGVTTHSSGNHAQALAYAAQSLGIKATIVMPDDAPSVKKKAVAGYKAEIRYCSPTPEAREAMCEEVQRKTGAIFIPSYNDNRIITGQGTAALELLKLHPDLDIILTPIGGGGLLSGSVIAAKGINSNIQVIGTEPEAANDAFLSFKKGELILVNKPNTICDGLKTSLGDLTFAVISSYVTDIVTVDENSILQAMRYIWERMKIVIEPSSAVPVAALLSGKVEAHNKKIGIIISGGNVDLDHLPWHQ
ncbi:MAG: pyridoxal-phosphate dependent enzyme [Balneolales bacterium]